MKIILLAFITVLSSAINAQSLKIINHNNNNLDVSGTTFTRVFDNVTGTDRKVQLKIENISGNPIDVYVKRVELNVQSGTENYFCWYACYGSAMAGALPQMPANVPSSHFNEILANSISTQTLDCHHVNTADVGTSCYRYVAYDGANPNDSVYVDVCFEVGYTGIETHDSFDAALYPNPSNGAFNIAIEKLTGTGLLEIFDLSGRQVFSTSITEGINTLHTSFENGTYYAIIKENGIVKATLPMIKS